MKTIGKVKTIINAYHRLSAACDAYRAIGAMEVDSELHNAIWTSFEHLLSITDTDGWISWFIYENDCGKRKMKAGYDGKLRIIDTPEKLAKLIEEADKRK